MHSEDSSLPGVSNKGDFLMPGERERMGIERSCLSNARRCRVFCCDPQRSGQKGSCEKNHVELRKILLKGSSFEVFAAFDVASVCAHADNYPRKSLKGKTPYALAVGLVPKRLLDKLGIARLRADEVTLKPSLLSNRQG